MCARRMDEQVAGTFLSCLLVYFHILLGCGVGEDSWESRRLQGDPISPFMIVPWLRIISRPLIGKCEVLTSELTGNSISYCYETDLYTFSSCKIETLYPSPVPLNNNSSFLPCFPRPWTPSFYFVTFYCLTILDISYKWKHKSICLFYDWLISFGLMS